MTRTDDLVPLDRTCSTSGPGAVRGVYTYRANDSGQLAALRAFWEFDAADVVA